MDIHQVRRKFQIVGEITVSTNTSLDISHVPYSLQQESLNSINMLLYITTATNLQLEGHVLNIKNQLWIVKKVMKETVNTAVYEYLLLPVLDVLVLRILNIVTNDIGVQLEGIPSDYTVNCFIDDRARAVRSNQLVDVIQQTFFVAIEEMPVDEVYEAYYRGRKYKISSLERLIGVVKLRLIEDI